MREYLSYLLLVAPYLDLFPFGSESDEGAFEQTIGRWKTLRMDIRHRRLYLRLA